jgi:hypothetical protein
MRKPLASWLTVLLLGAVTVQSTGCFGSFGLTHKLYGFNQGVSGNKFIRWLVFLGFVILPVYEIVLVADALVLNSIEFWTGNRLAAAPQDGEAQERVVHLNATDTLKLSREADSPVLRVELVREGEAPRVHYVEPLENGLAVRDEAGALVLAAHEREDGALALTDASGKTRAVHSAEVVARAHQAFLEGGARELARYTVQEAGPLARGLAHTTCTAPGPAVP